MAKLSQALRAELRKRLNDPNVSVEEVQEFARLAALEVPGDAAVVEELAQLAALAAPKPQPIDIARLLEELLEGHRGMIHERRLLVLKELDTVQPLALADEDHLRFAFEALLRKCLEIVPEQGDVYIASKHRETGLRGLPSVRVLVRFLGREGERGGAPVPGVSTGENALEFFVVDAVVRAQGGTLAVEVGEGDETVLFLDLPAPP